MGKNFFPGTAFTLYQYRYIRGSHLPGNINSTIQQRRVTDDSKSIFNILNIHLTALYVTILPINVADVQRSANTSTYCPGLKRSSTGKTTIVF